MTLKPDWFNENFSVEYTSTDCAYRSNVTIRDNRTGDVMYSVSSLSIVHSIDATLAWTNKNYEALYDGKKASYPYAKINNGKDLFM